MSLIYLKQKEMSKFKEGDKVRIISMIAEDGHEWSAHYAIGNIGVITSVMGLEPHMITYFIDDNTYGVNFDDNMLELVEDENIEKCTTLTSKHQNFSTGAYRDGENGKDDFEGYLSPIVLKSFGKYMTKHRKQSNGELRDSDNWQKGIPKEAYMKSMLRHVFDLWSIHRGFKVEKEGHEWDAEECLNAVLFNVMGYQFENLKNKK